MITVTYDLVPAGRVGVFVAYLGVDSLRRLFVAQRRHTALSVPYFLLYIFSTLNPFVLYHLA